MHYYFDDGASAKDGRKKGRIMWNDATAAALRCSASIYLISESISKLSNSDPPSNYFVQDSQL
jgi:hypothetical protein